MQAVRLALKKGYKKYFHTFLRRWERRARVLLFGFFRAFHHQFNPFRTFGIAHGVKSLLGEEVVPPAIAKMTFPKTVEKESHERFYVEEARSDGGRVTLVERGFATATAAHLSSSGQLIPNFTEQFSNSDIGFHKLFTLNFDRCFWKIAHFDQLVASLVADCHHNYYHWLFDVLPKLALLRKAKIQPEKYYVDTLKPFQIESLKILGIGDDQIISCRDYPVISASSLALTSFPCLSGKASWVVEFLREVFVGKEVAQPKTKIYISRKDAPCRHVVNDDEVAAFLEGEGFAIVKTEHLSFSEQVALFSRAEVVVSPHGAGLSNLVFCPKTAKVVEIFGPRVPFPCYWVLSNLIGLQYAYLRGEDKEAVYSQNGDHGHDNMIVDIEKLKNTLLLLR